MTQEELDNLLDEHDKWHNDPSRLQGKQLELRNVNLKGFNIGKRDLFKAKLEAVDLSESYCAGVRLAYAEMRHVKFCGANLNGSDLSEADMEDVDFSTAKMNEVQIHSLKNAERLVFDDAEMNKAFFVKSIVRDSSFKNARLTEADFKRAFIRNCSFERADIGAADFSHAYLVDVDGEEAKIDGANFSDARELPEQWKLAIGWYSEEQRNIRRIKEMLKEEGVG